MSPETVAAIQKALEPVAAKIGQGAQFSWEVVLQQQMVEAWIGVLTAVSCITLSIIGVTVIALHVRAIKRQHGDNWELFDTNPFVVGGIGAALLFTVFGFATGTYTAVTHFLNPAYYALDFFIHLTK